MAETGNRPVRIIKETHYPTSDWFKREDGIVVTYTPDNVLFTLQDAKIFVQAMEEFTASQVF